MYVEIIELNHAGVPIAGGHRPGIGRQRQRQCMQTSIVASRLFRLLLLYCSAAWKQIYLALEVWPPGLAGAFNVYPISSRFGHVRDDVDDRFDPYAGDNPD